MMLCIIFVSLATVIVAMGGTQSKISRVMCCTSGVLSTATISLSLLSMHVYLCDFLQVFWVAAVHHYEFGCTQVLTKVVSLDHLAFESGTTA